MSELKTKPTNASVVEYLNSVEPEHKRKDGLKLLEMMERVTGEKAVMWGAGMVGFGSYHYKSERSKQEGDWPLVGFSPRKQNLTIYIMPGFDDKQELLSKLGKNKTSVGCLYINKLADVDMGVLEDMVKLSTQQMRKRYL